MENGTEKRVEKRGVLAKVPEPEEVSMKCWLFGIGIASALMSVLGMELLRAQARKVKITEVGRHPNPRFPVM